MGSPYPPGSSIDGYPSMLYKSGLADELAENN